MRLKIGIRRSPHLDELARSIEAHGDYFVSTHDTGADFYLAWGWPQAEQVARDNGGRHSRIICMDAHPFALKAGDSSGSRILQLGNWGALAKYPTFAERFSTRVISPPLNRATRHGPLLVLGQVYTAIQAAGGLVDTWHTHGYEALVRAELANPRRVFRKHPRVWAVENPGAAQPPLESDLQGCSGALSWNSTAGVHSLMLGYPAWAAESHGWAAMPLGLLAAQELPPSAIRSGAVWAEYRAWLALRLQSEASSGQHSRAAL